MVALGLLSILSCGGERLLSPLETSRLEVLVSWDGQGLSGRRLDIVELSLSRTTDSLGVAAFALPAGTFTLRAYVNMGGPAGFTDFKVTTRRGETTKMEVVDCLPCVSPS